MDPIGAIVAAMSGRVVQAESAPRLLDPQLATIGIVGGVLSGLLGVGGGVVMVPLLVLWAGYAQRDAHAASLGAIIPISIAGILTYGLAGRVYWLDAAALAAGAVAGALVGAGVLTRIDERILKVLFGCFLVAVAVRWECGPDRHGTVARSRGVGLCTGVAAGLLGVGGGILMVPFLTLALGLSQHAAEATSLVVVLPTAVVASIVLRRHGVGDLGTALRFGLVGAIGGMLGALLALMLPGSILSLSSRSFSR